MFPSKLNVKAFDFVRFFFQGSINNLSCFVSEPNQTTLLEKYIHFFLRNPNFGRLNSGSSPFFSLYLFGIFWYLLNISSAQFPLFISSSYCSTMPVYFFFPRRNTGFCMQSDSQPQPNSPTSFAHSHSQPTRRYKS